MALVAQSGIAYFDKGRIRKFRSTNGMKIKKEKERIISQGPSGDGDAFEDVEEDKLSTQILHLVEINEIPKVEVLQKLLKTAFSRLNSSELLFVQSILQCLWTLQGWTRPLDYQEEKLSQHAEDTFRMKTVDLTRDDDDEESKVKKKMANFKFEKFVKPMVKTNAIATASMSAEIQRMVVTTPSTSAVAVPANTPTSKNTTSTTPSSLAKSTKVPSDTVASSTSLMGQRHCQSNPQGKHLLALFSNCMHVH
jgi:hypothetical protein